MILEYIIDRYSRYNFISTLIDKSINVIKKIIVYIINVNAFLIKYLY